LVRFGRAKTRANGGENKSFLQGERGGYNGLNLEKKKNDVGVTTKAEIEVLPRRKREKYKTSLRQPLQGERQRGKESWVKLEMG